MKLLEKHPQFATARKITKLLRSNGHEALFAGGCVRDAFLQRPARDIDIATSATPDQVERLFEKTVAVGKSFGVIRVILDGFDIEVATFRKDGLYVDGRRPETVQFSSRKEDAERRDFTMNALFYDESTGQLYDDVGGVNDLKEHLIRAVGTAEKRFEEDHLRLLRAVRFSGELDFLIENDTWKALSLCSDLIRTVSGERIHAEITKLVHGHAIQRGMETLYQSGLLAEMLGHERLRWVPLQPFLQGPGDERWWFFWRWLMAVDESLKTLVELKEVWERWRFSNQEKTKFARLLETSLQVQWQKMRRGELLENYFDADFQLGLKLSLRIDHPGEDMESQAEWLEARFHELGQKKPEALIKAQDLMDKKQGQTLGAALKEAYFLQLENPTLTKENLLQKVEA